MDNLVSKSKFKPRALEYFRMVEHTKKELIITDHGRPVLKIVPFSEDHIEVLKTLRNTVIEYTDYTDPIGLDDWESLK